MEQAEDAYSGDTLVRAAISWHKKGRSSMRRIFKATAIVIMCLTAAQSVEGAVSFVFEPQPPVDPDSGKIVVCVDDTVKLNVNVVGEPEYNTTECKNLTLKGISPEPPLILIPTAPGMTQIGGTFTATFGSTPKDGYSQDDCVDIPVSETKFFDILAISFAVSVTPSSVDYGTPTLGQLSGKADVELAKKDFTRAKQELEEFIVVLSQSSSPASAQDVQRIRELQRNYETAITKLASARLKISGPQYPQHPSDPVITVTSEPSGLAATLADVTKKPGDWRSTATFGDTLGILAPSSSGNTTLTTSYITTGNYGNAQIQATVAPCPPKVVTIPITGPYEEDIAHAEQARYLAEKAYIDGTVIIFKGLADVAGLLVLLLSIPFAVANPFIGVVLVVALSAAALLANRIIDRWGDDAHAKNLAQLKLNINAAEAYPQKTPIAGADEDNTQAYIDEVVN